LRYQLVGQQEKALASSSVAMRIDPKDSYAYQNVADAYERLNRFDEARSVAEQGVAQNLGDSIHFTLFDLAVIRGDEAAKRHEVQWFSGRAFESLILWFDAESELAVGKLQAGRAGYAQSESAAQRAGYKELSGIILAFQGLAEMQLGNLTEARQKMSDALAASQDRNTQRIVMVLLAQTGDGARSQKIAEELVRQRPTNTLLNKVWVPLSQAYTDLQHNQPAQALAHLEVAVPYEFGTGPGAATYTINYLRGDAYLRLKDGAKAAAEYQKILDHRGIDPTNATYDLSHLGLGRALALQGNTAGAKSAYQDFFGAWKDADPDLPVLKQAKAEYEKLQ
jgi:tetratricopeptide (TPR) repeat protein